MGPDETNQRKDYGKLDIMKEADLRRRIKPGNSVKSRRSGRQEDAFLRGWHFCDIYGGRNR